LLSSLSWAIDSATALVRIGFGRLDAPLPAAPAKLHHAAFGQSAVGDIARRRRINDGPGAWAQAEILVEFAQAVERLAKVEGLAFDRSLAEILREFERQATNSFFAVFDDHLIDARFKGLRRAAESHRAAGLSLQAERRELERLRHRYGLIMTGRPEHGQFGEALTQTGFETRDAVDAAFVLGAVDNGLDRCVAAPQIGTAQSANSRYLHGQFPLSDSVRTPVGGAGSLRSTTQAMVNVCSPVRMISGPMPSAHAAPLAARTFSIW
jgi:hypothetical protein